MENRKENNTQQQNKLNYRQRELNNNEIFEEEYKYFLEIRNESDELYMISSILNSNF